MKVLIIGGTGNISTGITRTLAERGEDMTVYNRGRREQDFPGKVTVVKGDRTDYIAFERQMARLGKWDCVIDMICYLPEEAQSDVQAFRARTDQFIFCSTVDVYTKPATRLPYTEDEPLMGVSLYGKRKVICEGIFTDADRRGAFAATIMRPAQTYSETHRLLSTLLHPRYYYLDRLRKGKPIVVHGDGSSLWVACHRDDVARAFVSAIGNEDAYGRAYHVTGEEWMTWDKMHQTVAMAVGGPEPRLVHIPTDLLGTVARRAQATVENFQFNNIFDNTAARLDLGFDYTIPFLEGARRHYQYQEAHGLIANSDEDDYEDRVVAAWERAGMELGRDLAGLDGSEK